MSAILAIAHPELYKAGVESLVKLGQCVTEAGEDVDRSEVLKDWPTVANGISLVSDRSTPFHRDSNSRSEWYDILATLGDYTDTVMEFPGLGMRMEYEGGMVMAFSGRFLQHGVSECAKERICLAMYMRDNIHHRLKVKPPGWMTTEYYKSFVD